MPELPEVETVVRELRSAGLVGRRIAQARVFWRKTVAAPDSARFMREIASPDDGAQAVTFSSSGS